MAGWVVRSVEVRRWEAVDEILEDGSPSLLMRRRRRLDSCSGRLVRRLQMLCRDLVLMWGRGSLECS
jgi:hypothetical protein